MCGYRFVEEFSWGRVQEALSLSTSLSNWPLGQAHFSKARNAETQNKKMAGNEEPKQISQPSPYSSSRTKIEEPQQQQEEAKEMCWRKQVDQNLKRLDSLLFGAELALERRDFSAARILGLRLLGFLDSHSHSELDQAFVYPIRREAAAKIAAANHSLAPDSDRYGYALP